MDLVQVYKVDDKFKNALIGAQQPHVIHTLTAPQKVHSGICRQEPNISSNLFAAYQDICLQLTIKFRLVNC
jgi:hypothetical protein